MRGRRQWVVGGRLSGCGCGCGCSACVGVELPRELGQFARTLGESASVTARGERGSRRGRESSIASLRNNPNNEILSNSHACNSGTHSLESTSTSTGSPAKSADSHLFPHARTPRRSEPSQPHLTPTTTRRERTEGAGVMSVLPRPFTLLDKRCSTRPLLLLDSSPSSCLLVEPWGVSLNLARESARRRRERRVDIRCSCRQLELLAAHDSAPPHQLISVLS